MLLPTNLHRLHPWEAPMPVFSVSPLLVLARSRPLPAHLRKEHALLPNEDNSPLEEDNFIYWKAFWTVFSSFGLDKLLFTAVWPNISGLTCFISGLTAHLNYIKWIIFYCASDTWMARRCWALATSSLKTDGKFKQEPSLRPDILRI